jgi:hypothetical protein
VVANLCAEEPAAVARAGHRVRNGVGVDHAERVNREAGAEP